MNPGRAPAWAFTYLTVCALGCSDVSAPAALPTEPDALLHFQIALRNRPFKTGDTPDSGEYAVVNSHLIPLSLVGGPRHVISAVDGVTFEMRWRATGPPRYRGSHPEVVFSDFGWVIRNRLVYEPTRIEYRWDEAPKRYCSSKWCPLITAICVNTSIKEAPTLVIRWRLEHSRPKFRDIDMASRSSGCRQAPTKKAKHDTR